MITGEWLTERINMLAEAVVDGQAEDESTAKML